MKKKCSLSIAYLCLLIFGFIFCPANMAFLSATTRDTLPSLEKGIEYNNKNATSSKGPLTLITGTYNDQYQLDSSHKTGFFYVALKVADVQVSTRRVPLNISIVVDRSGSMAGDKIEFAKKAAKRIVDRLDSTDYVSIIVYDNFINVLQKATLDTNRKEIKNRIDKMVARGSTNLWGGAQKGYEEVMKNYKSGYINRVLLISDGQANVGVTNPASIKFKVQQYRDSGISISTFGVGLDYNELLMTQMAEAGKGNYYFIDSANKMTLLFEKELTSILSLAARKATLKIIPPQGVQLESLTEDGFEQHGNEMILRLDDLFSDETKSYLFRFNIPDKAKKPLQFHTNLNYLNLADYVVTSINNENSLMPAKDKKVYLGHFNQDVINQIILLSIGNNIEKALLFSDEGNYSSAKAVLVVNDQYLKSNNYYVDHSEELRKIRALNLHYLSSLQGIKKLNKDAIKMIQKANREAIYELRNKKEG